MNLQDQLYAQELTNKFIAAINIKPGAKSFGEFDIEFSDAIHNIVDHNPRVKDRGWRTMAMPSFRPDVKPGPSDKWRYFVIELWFHESSIDQKEPDYAVILDINGKIHDQEPRLALVRAINAFDKSMGGFA